MNFVTNEHHNTQKTGILPRCSILKLIYFRDTIKIYIELNKFITIYVDVFNYTS